MNLRAFASAAVVALSFVAASVAQATTFQFITGDTTGGPTFDRAVADFSELDADGAGVSYTTYAFTVSVSGDYFFNTSSNYDSYSFLYQGSFNPADPTSNGVAGNDDLYFGSVFFSSGFEVALTAGTTYVFVSTGYSAADFGAYSTTIAGPVATTPVPEVETYLMMALGLGGLVVLRRRQFSER